MCLSKTGLQANERASKRVNTELSLFALSTSPKLHCEREVDGLQAIPLELYKNRCGWYSKIEKKRCSSYLFVIILQSKMKSEGFFL